MKNSRMTALIMCCFIFLNLAAQKEGLNVMSQTDLRAGMAFFASDDMRGRETASHENDIAALYLRTNIMQLGLKPIPETGDYFQKVPLVSSEIKRGETYIEGTGNKGEKISRTDSVIYLMAPGVTQESSSRLVFAGYGFRDSVSGYNDFANIDVRDKVILMMTGTPEMSDPDQINMVFNIDIERSKLITAVTNQVKAVLFVYDPRSKFSDAYASGLSEMGAARPGAKFMSLKPTHNSHAVQVAFITRYAADQLLKRDGQTIKELQEKIIKDRKPVSFESKETNVNFRTFVEEVNIAVNNVIGMVEGSDPVLKKECILYTAHFDHIGVNGNGEAFNGADDNASGSISLLEVAKAYMNLKKKPARTILFAWVNGEEKGLLGSQYYTDNPVISMENTLLDINLDMVGRSKMPSDTGTFMGFEINVSNKGEILMYTDQKGRDLLGIIDSRSKESGIKTINMGRDPEIGSSDYASFMEKGVPAIFFNSGDYPDLHTIRDDVDKIDFDKMERVTRMVFLVGYDIANQKNRFVPDTIKSEQ